MKHIGIEGDDFGVLGFSESFHCGCERSGGGGTVNIALVNFHDLVFYSPFKYPFADLGFTSELDSSLMMSRVLKMH